jgi:8-oxo-dGTP diphosphatase
VSAAKQKANERDASAVRAAGGVIVRRRGRFGRRVEVALVHRPRYDDWTFPKGKRDGEETDEETALREVEEETGLRCRLGADLGTVTYVDAYGRDKAVRYWLMEVGEGQDSDHFVPNREVDELRWTRPRDAARLLTYDHDRVLIDRLEQVDR